MSLKPPVVEMQHSCGLLFVGWKNSAHPSQQLPTAVFTDCIAIVAVLARGLVAAPLKLCMVWVVVSVSRAVERVGGPSAPLSIGTTWWACSASLRWGMRADKGWEGRGRGLMEVSAVGWKRNHKPWVISRLQKGKKVTVSRPKPWLFCTLIYPGWNADFERPFLTPAVDHGWQCIGTMDGAVSRGATWGLQDFFLLKFDLETDQTGHLQNSFIICKQYET